MGEVKSGWTLVRLREVVRRYNERVQDPAGAGFRRFLKVEHLDPQRVTVERWGAIGEDELPPTFRNAFQPGHVLYPSRNPHLRRTAQPNFGGICGEKTFVIEASLGLAQDLLPYVLSSERCVAFATTHSIGSTNKHIRWRDLAEYEFALPPLGEQERIAGVLRQTTAVSDELARARSTASLVVEATLRDAFPEFPSHWQHSSVSLASVTEHIGDGTHQSPKFTSEGIPFLLVSNISRGSLDPAFKKFVGRPEYEVLVKSFRPRRGDILYSLVGSYGVPLLVDWDWDFTFQRHVGVLRVDRAKLHPRFLYWFLRSPAGARQAHRFAEGLAQKTITLTALRGFSIPVPSLVRQREISDRLDELQTAEAAVDRRLMAAREVLAQLREGLLG